MFERARERDDPATGKRGQARIWTLVVVLIVAAFAFVWYVQSEIPRHLVIASGLREGMYHEWADRYRAILARDGIKLEERLTGGAEENQRLLLDPKSGVDIAFSQGGVASPAARENLRMLAAIYYEPLWVFYRGKERLTQIDQLRYKRVAIGAPGSGVRAFVEPMLAANNVTGFNSTLEPLVGVEALRALQRGEVDAAMLVGSVRAEAIWQALHDKSLKLMSVERSDAYERLFPYVKALTLPSGGVDLGLNIPPQTTKLIATEAMLIARDDLPKAIVDLLINAARDLHSPRGLFEDGDEFPNTHAVDLPVATESERHLKFGPGILHRYLPFFVATYAERLIIVLLPLLVLLIPAVNLLPRLLDWRVRSRVYRWYGELSLLEREARRRGGEAPIDEWMARIDKIELAASRIRIPARFASEAYTLREHISLVRHAVLARANAPTDASADEPEPA